MACGPPRVADVIRREFGVRYHPAHVSRLLRQLLRQVPGKLLVIWDGAPIHRGRAVKDVLAGGAAARLHLEQLPGFDVDGRERGEVFAIAELWEEVVRERDARPRLPARF